MRSLEEAAAAGELAGWRLADADVETRKRALVVAADHQRLAVIDALVLAGTPVDEEDARHQRHPLRLAAAHGRAESVRRLLQAGADPSRRDHQDLTPLDHARHGRAHAVDPAGHEEVERILGAWPRA